MSTGSELFTLLLFNIFLNDLEIKLGNETLGFKYADDCTIIALVYDDI